MKILVQRLARNMGAAGLGILLLTGCSAPQQENSQKAVAVGAATTGNTAVAAGPVVTLYKNPTCQCCAEWGEHLRQNGFRVDIKEGADLTRVRSRLGVPDSLASCHTAEVDGYVIEGHVPADVLQELLRKRPQVTGLAVPGMPAGVPGMPDAGPNRPPYPIVAFTAGGSSYVYAER